MSVRNRIDQSVRWLLIIIMSLIVIDVSLQVISRYLFQSPFAFTDELAGYLLIWLGLLGSAYATGEKQHLAIDLISGSLSAERKRYLDILINILVISFALSVLVVGGIWLVYTSFIFGQISASLQLSLGYVYMVVPLSGLLIIYYSIDNTRNVLHPTTE
ncbi:TRAP transporter small permease [Catalinimonas niigatensis]|uniref:TRAP transporter small permease n=1 Tax=Catalinimonas niigatensis TaxID=1397264 RepID=UPI002666F8C1|nr:TRAP transporter small permease [Catalinimonas niigatensis]WPP50049.1 TRAP transporter small permease [Catalinimonas niigatensis]